MYTFLLRALPALLLFIVPLCPADNCGVCTKPIKHTYNSLSPVIRLTATPCAISQDLGISLLGELGTKNYRIGGNLGGIFNYQDTQHRVKVGAEFLTQKLQYSFYHGRLHRWVNQYAIGAGYQFLMPSCTSVSSWISSIDFNGSYSHAFSRNINSVVCPVDTTRNETPTLFRNIAGGNNGHFDLGTTLTPWKCGKLFVGIDYDYTSYKRKYQHNVRTSGVGGSVWLNQRLGRNCDLDLGAEFRRPFNYYSAAVKWNTPFTCGNLSLGIFGSYTKGKNDVPNNSMAGVSIDFAFGGSPLFNARGPSCSGSGWCDMGPCDCPCTCDSELLAWLANPSVYMPTVLAIADQQFQFGPPPPNTCPACPTCPVCPPPCIPPSSTVLINPNGGAPITEGNPLFIPSQTGGSYNASPFFTGASLVYTITPDFPTTAPNDVTINPITGVVTIAPGTLIANPLPFTITATNSCGSTEQILWLVTESG